MTSTEILNTEETEGQGEIKSFSAPRLDAKDRLYLKAYLSTLSHIKAHEVVAPLLKVHREDNPFSRKDSIQFHISMALQERADALMITPEIIIEKLFKEATREGAGSNHAARIQALTQLGKHFGLFQEKKENTSHVFNIVNYGTIDPIELIEQTEPSTLIEYKEEEDTSDLLENVVLSDYSN